LKFYYFLFFIIIGNFDTSNYWQGGYRTVRWLFIIVLYIASIWDESFLEFLRTK